MSFRFLSDHKHPVHRVLIGLFAWVVGGSFAVWGIQFALADESTPFFNERAGGPLQTDQRDFERPNRDQNMPFRIDDSDKEQGDRGMMDDRGIDEQQDNSEREEKMEAQRKAQMERQFTQMKNGLKQTSSMLKRTATRVASMEKAGVRIPDDFKDNFEAINADLKIVLGATSLEDEGVQEAMDDLQSRQQDLQEGMSTLERLAQFPGMLKRIQSEIKKLDTSLVKAKKVAMKSKVSVTSTVEDFSMAMTEIKASLEKAKASIAAGDADEAMQILEEEVFENMQEARQAEQAINLLQNVSSNLGKMNSFITQSRSKLLRMQKKGEDVIEALAEVDEMDAKVAELKQVLIQKPILPEDINDIAQELWEKRQDIEEVLGQGQNHFSF